MMNMKIIIHFYKRESQQLMKRWKILWIMKILVLMNVLEDVEKLKKFIIENNILMHQLVVENSIVYKTITILQ